MNRAMVAQKLMQSGAAMFLVEPQKETTGTQIGMFQFVSFVS
jgi:hypothetical protein